MNIVLGVLKGLPVKLVEFAGIDNFGKVNRLKSK